MAVSVQPDWCTLLPIQQQSVLFLACRGPDGIGKSHPCKEIQRAYRATVMVAARYNRMLTRHDEGDSFMSLAPMESSIRWNACIDAFFLDVDALPHHFVMHFLHGAQIITYKHPDYVMRERWRYFYGRGCEDMHLYEETEAEMDKRLNDWGQQEWGT